MDYDSKSNLVQKAIELFVSLMAEEGSYRLPRDKVVAAVNKLHPTAGYDQSLFRNLVTEGVFAENHWYGAKGTKDVVQITYERFADHLLARHLLDSCLDPKNPAKAFSPRAKLQTAQNRERLFAPVGSDRGFLGPATRTGGEGALRVRPTHPVLRCGAASVHPEPGLARCESLRKSGLRVYVDSLLRSELTCADVLDAMLTVAPVPDHPLNADKLHRLLCRASGAQARCLVVDLPPRTVADAAGGRPACQLGVGRLPAGFSPSDDVVNLAGTAMPWFLTSSNRFLRDRATKALVRLFDNKLSLLRRLLEKFRRVDDPYVARRFMAVAYRCAMRSRSSAGLSEIAEEVAARKFSRSAGLIPQLLTRDSRGVVELRKGQGRDRSQCFPGKQPSLQEQMARNQDPVPEDTQEVG